MKAVVLREHGGLDKLQYVTDFPDPVVTEGHVVIRVRATSFNYHDVFTVRGMPGIKVPLPVVIGTPVRPRKMPWRSTGAPVGSWLTRKPPTTEPGEVRIWSESPATLA